MRKEPDKFGWLLFAAMLIAATCVGFWTAKAHAQTTCAVPPATPPWNTAVLAWAAPTLYTDGTAIGSAAITYKVYGTAATALCTTTALTAAIPNLVAGPNQCWTATATVAGQESAKTVQACKNIVQPPKVPNPPSNLTVAADLTAWILAPTTNRVAMLPVGTFTPGTQCDQTQPVLDKYVAIVDAAHPVIKPPTSTNQSVVFLATCG